MSRTRIYIDGGPFLDAIRGQGLSMDMNLMSFAKDIVPEDDVAAVNFILAETPEHPYPLKLRNERKRLASFAQQGVHVEVTRTQVIESVFIDRGVEALMATRMVTDATTTNLLKRMILISRRAEFAPVIEAVKTFGVHVTVAYFPFSIAPENPLFPFGSDVIEIPGELALRHRISGPKPPQF